MAKRDSILHTNILILYAWIKIISFISVTIIIYRNIHHVVMLGIAIAIFLDCGEIFGLYRGRFRFKAKDR